MDYLPYAKMFRFSEFLADDCFDVPCFASSQFLPPSDCDLLFLSLQLVSAKGSVVLRGGILDIVLTCLIPMYFLTNLLSYWTILLS